jgi:hypothetical protein
MSHIALRGRWCNITALNMHAPSKDRRDDVKDSFYEELGCVFGKFSWYYTKTLLHYFNAKVGRKDSLKPTMGDESLSEINSNNGVRVVNFDTSKNLVVKSTMFPYRDIHNYTHTSPEEKMHNQTDHVLRDSRRHSSIMMFNISERLIVILTTIWQLQKLGKHMQ